MVVYLDANAYIGAKYNFDILYMSHLKKLIEEKKIQLLISELTVGEVNKHIKEDVAKEANFYNKSIKKEVPILFQEGNFDLKFIDVDEAINVVLNKANEFFNLDGVSKIPLNPLDADELMKDYFDKLPPFENQKPDEFKDAIMINAIKNYQKTQDERICIVSNDKGVQKAFDGNCSFMVFNYLSNFLKFCSIKFEEPKVERIITEEIKKCEFEKALTQYIYDIELYLDDYSDYEVDYREILNYEYKLDYISTEKDRVQAVISATVEEHIDIQYRDEESSYYDKEEGKYLFERYLCVNEKHKYDVEIVWDFYIKVDKNDEFILENFELDKSCHNAFVELDDDTRIDKEIIYDSFNDDNNF